MDIQNIIVYLVIAVAVIIAGYRIFMSVSGKKSGCEGCESDCSGCSLTDLKRDIEEAKDRKNS